MPEKDLKEGDDKFQNNKIRRYGVSCAVKEHGMMGFITTIVSGNTPDEAMQTFMKEWASRIDDMMHAIVIKKYGEGSWIYTCYDMSRLRDEYEVEIEKGVFE